jgi:predicted RNase H-like nuclease
VEQGWVEQGRVKKVSGQPQSGSRVGPRTRPTVLGVDGCRGAWVAVELPSGRWHHGRLGEAVAGSPDAAYVGVDIPLGLAAAGRRACDEAGRLALAGAASRLFYAPPRFAYDADTYAGALAALRAAAEPGMSAQTWSLRSAVLEAEAVARHDRRLVEVHPELTFVALSGRVLPGKRTAAGVAARLGALTGELEPWLGEGAVLAAVAACPPGVPVDDALDALAAAATAGRLAAGVARSYPQRPLDGVAVIWA